MVNIATINSVTFNLESITPVVIHKNVVSEQPGSDTNFIDDMGYKGLVLRITGYEETLSKYDEVINEFMKDGEHTLIYRTGYQYEIYSAQLVSVLLEGVVDNYFPYELILLTSTPYRESTTSTTRSKSITTNNQTWTQDDSSNDIDTDGSVDALPDIAVTGGAVLTEITQTENDSNYNTNAGAAGVTITQSEYESVGFTLSSVGFLAQTINCRKAGMAIIDSIQIDIHQVDTAGDCTCTVYDSISGTVLGSKVLNISTAGLKTFTFVTPIAVVQDENTCADSTDSKKIYFKFTVTGSTVIRVYNKQNTNPYPDGSFYINTGIFTDADLKFVVTGHSCKEIRQTFKVPTDRRLYKITLNMCKYQYTGSNAVTVVIKEGGTTLGTGTAVLSGTTFADVEFYLTEETPGSLSLENGTTYNIIITPPTGSVNATCVLIKTKTTSVYSDGEVTLVENGGTLRAQTHDLYFKMYFGVSVSDVEIYNTADTTVKCAVANEIMNGAVHRINVDGTGTVFYDDDFTTEKWRMNSTFLNVTHDTVNDELDIADDGYIYWKCDTKGAISGKPAVTALIDITAGLPTIQISEDASTWYNIDTEIVDNIETVYELDCSSLTLKGKSLFYYRLDCVKTAAATCTLKNFELNVDFGTMDFEHPRISEDGVSTMRCDQGSDSGMICTVALYYRGRWWPV